MLTQAQQEQRRLVPSYAAEMSPISLKGASVEAMVNALIDAHGDNAHRFAQAVEREVDKALANNR